jgi:hypothetical protein
MKIIYVLGTAILLAACSTHSIRCRGALQPINKAAAPARESKPAPTERRP